MKSVLKFLVFVCLIFSFPCVFASINFSLTPIKYELTANTGSTITKPATIKNNSDTTVTLYTGKSDFQSNGTGGVPEFVRKSELVYKDQELSSWITLDRDKVTIEPGKEATINFTINVPANATPG